LLLFIFLIYIFCAAIYFYENCGNYNFSDLMVCSTLRDSFLVYLTLGLLNSPKYDETSEIVGVEDDLPHINVDLLWHIPIYVFFVNVVIIAIILGIIIDTFGYLREQEDFLNN